MISVRFQGKPFNITVIQAYAPTSNTEEAEVERFYEDLQDLLELTPEKDVLFIIGVAIRRGEGAQMKWCRDPRCSLEGTQRVGELLRSHQGCQLPFRT